ncbi:MAG: RNA methyltransferase [Candidatus Altiarchaeota archaeon]|nr:RNA methyltransferase [Candidatus Altiarchaeota archaeon]
MPEFSIVLVEPKYEGNVGSVARLMKNFGFKDLVLIDPPIISCEARAMAMHGKDVLGNARTAGDLKDINEEFDYLVATTAVTAGDKNALRTPILPEDLEKALDTKGKIALVFGREDCGLSNEEIALCDLIVTIPADKDYPTLNLSHSVAIILYEIRRHEMRREAHSLRKMRDLNKVEKDTLLAKFDAFSDLVYDREYDRKMARKTFRQVIGRAFISGKEAYTMIGIYRKAADKLGKKR